MKAEDLLAVEDRLDELDELRESLPGRAPLLAAMLGALYYYGGIFLIAAAGFLVSWSVAEREWLPGRLVGAVVVGGVGWAAFREGGELRGSADARRRMIELEDEFAELRGGDR